MTLTVDLGLRGVILSILYLSLRSKVYLLPNFKQGRLKYFRFGGTAGHGSYKLVEKFRTPRSQCFSPQMNNWHPWQLKKSKSWGPLLSYQLDSSANLAQLPQKWAKWAELAVLFS
jgi:hypothetical protein